MKEELLALQYAGRLICCCRAEYLVKAPRRVRREGRDVAGPSWLDGPMSPRLAACCEIGMGITMSYMLITML